MNATRAIPFAGVLTGFAPVALPLNRRVCVRERALAAFRSGVPAS